MTSIYSFEGQVSIGDDSGRVTIVVVINVYLKRGVNVVYIEVLLACFRCETHMLIWPYKYCSAKYFEASLSLVPNEARPSYVSG